MDYEDQTQLGSEVDELEELASELESVPTDDSAPAIETPADARMEAEFEDDLASGISGGTLPKFEMSPKAEELRSHPAVQRVVQDIMSVRSADEIAALVAQDPTEVPTELVAEAKLDYAVVENGDTVIGSPIDVASAVWAELHSGTHDVIAPTSETVTPAASGDDIGSSPEAGLPPTSTSPESSGETPASYGSLGM